MGGLALQLFLENEVLRPDTEIDKLLLRGVQRANGPGRGRTLQELSSDTLARQARTRQGRWAIGSNATGATHGHVDAWQLAVRKAVVESPMPGLSIYRL